jgi:hypothetical protein
MPSVAWPPPWLSQLSSAILAPAGGGATASEPPASAPQPTIEPAPASERQSPPPPQPPDGAAIYWQDANGRACPPESAFMWTWEKATTWYYVSQFPVPGPSVMKIDTPSWVKRSTRGRPGRKPIYAGSGKLIGTSPKS